MVTLCRQRLRADDGFTLTELLVVISLMGMLLAAVYSALTLTTRAAETQQLNSFQARALTAPLQSIEVVLSQNTLIETGATQYRVSCLTDQDNNGVRERHVFEATTDGRLVQTVTLVNSAGTNIQHVRTTVWQEAATNPPTRNVNRLKNRPLFRFIRRDLATGHATELALIAANQANEIVVDLEVRYAGVDYREGRTVMLRNR